MGDKGKFELVALDKAQVVHEVNAVGGEISEYRNASPLEKAELFSGAFFFAMEKDGMKKLNIAHEALSLGLDSHEGRKEFLSTKLGVDANTPDDYRFVYYTNDSGQMTYFKGHMDGDKKLVLTESLAAPETSDQVHAFVQAGFKPLPKPIEVQIEKSIPAGNSTQLEASPVEQKKTGNTNLLGRCASKIGGYATCVRMPACPPSKPAKVRA